MDNANCLMQLMKGCFIVTALMLLRQPMNANCYDTVEALVAEMANGYANCREVVEAIVRGLIVVPTTMGS